MTVFLIAIQRGMSYANLQALMARRNMLRKDLAKLLGRDNAVATNLLNGDRPLATEEAKMLAKYFEVSIDTILDSAPLAAGNRLRALREDRGYTLEGLARASGIKVVELRKYEKSGPLEPRRKERLASVLECHPSDLDVMSPTPVRTPATSPASFREPTRAMNEYRLSYTTSIEWDDRFTFLLDAHHSRVPSDFIGKLCWIETDEGTPHVGFVHRSKKAFSRYDLTSFPDASETLTNLRIKSIALVKAWIQHS